MSTEYYRDGAKILGESRSDGKELRYFYDHDGLIGFKYNGNYYDFATGTNIDADDIESVKDGVEIIGGLDRNAPTRGNFFGIAANGFDITTSDKLTPDITYTPAEEKELVGEKLA